MFVFCSAVTVGSDKKSLLAGTPNAARASEINSFARVEARGRSGWDPVGLREVESLDQADFERVDGGGHFLLAAVQTGMTKGGSKYRRIKIKDISQKNFGQLFISLLETLNILIVYSICVIA